MTLNSNNRSRIHPQKFALWLAMGSILMMFMAFTSAYFVKQATGSWVEYRLPNMFYLNSAIILLSSLTLHISYKSFVGGQEGKYKWLLVISFVLGIAFLAGQYLAWSQLFEMGIDLKGNASGAFLYLITGVHALHIFGGLAAIFVALIRAFTWDYKVTDKRKNRFEMTLQYWHFVDILWIYLFILLLFTK